MSLKKIKFGNKEINKEKFICQKKSFHYIL